MPETAGASRRALLTGTGAACAVLITGCATYNANNGGVDAPQPPADPTSAPPAPGTTPAGSGSAPAASGAPVGGSTPASAPAASALARTADVPVGGGDILADRKIVITQPAAGTFKAFSAVCTHQGCLVGDVSGGTINCPCHGSKFSVQDGSVVSGPAGSPLAPVAITVQGPSILPA